MKYDTLSLKHVFTLIRISYHNVSIGNGVLPIKPPAMGPLLPPKIHNVASLLLTLSRIIILPFG
jgi:hypothetical protein